MSTPGAVSITTNANGVGSVDIAPNQFGLIWRIYQVALNAGGSVVTVYLSINDKPCTSSVTSVTPLAAQGDPALDLGGHDKLTVNVSNAPPTTVIPVSYFYDELHGVL